MAKKKRDPIERQMDRCREIVDEIHREFNAQGVTFPQGVTVALMLLWNGVHSALDEPDPDSELREQVLYALRTLVGMLEHPEKYPIRELPEYRM